MRRSEETVNPELPTGEVEILVAEAEVLADSETPPFEIEGFSGEVGEDARLRHRYLDLRREPMQRALALRHRVTTSMRSFLGDEGFLEIETPVLTRSTPEGARDFLVPSRLQQGSFYALPQSPQLFKQLLMVAGFERYFQIARCFRDEDLRADRQPDFTQLDLEMSFVGVEDVIDLNERLIAHVLGEMGIEVAPPFPRIAYDDAIARFGTDRPDTRFGLEIADLTDILEGTEFNAFGSVIGSGGVVRGINAGRRDLSRAELDGLIEEAKELGAKGLVWAFREGEGWRAPIAKFLSAEELSALNDRLGASEGDLMLVAADQPARVAAILGGLRQRLGRRWGLIPEGVNELSWIVDWPLFERNPDEDRWEALHHPFTSPAARIDPADPGAARALAYDIVWNGVELGGGSIRIHDPEVQRAAFEVLGIGRGGGRGALRLPARGASLWRTAARRHRLRARPLGRPAARQRLDPRRDRLPQDRLRRRSPDAAPAPVDERQLRDLGLQARVKRPG